jgi:glycosyltransferase involved in cell wall biosynthesis
MLAAVAPGYVVEFGKQLRRVLQGIADAQSIIPVLRRGPVGLRRWVLRHCAGIYPNSQWEATVLHPFLDAAGRERVVVIPNGVDTSLVEEGWSADQFRKRWAIEFDKFILSVARFDERKNNLGLIRAVRDLRYPCVLMGAPAPLHRRYFQRCVNEAQPAELFRFITSGVSQQELAGGYRAAHVHALPSWLETPGLVNLEAALLGANLVVGECPAVREYFGSAAWYCDPASVESIGSAIGSAWVAPRNARELDVVVRQQYGWDRVAERQIGAYRLIRSAGCP